MTISFKPQGVTPSPPEGQDDLSVPTTHGISFTPGVAKAPEATKSNVAPKAKPVYAEPKEEKNWFAARFDEVRVAGKQLSKAPAQMSAFLEWQEKYSRPSTDDPSTLTLEIAQGAFDDMQGRRESILAQAEATEDPEGKSKLQRSAYAVMQEEFQLRERMGTATSSMWDFAKKSGEGYPEINAENRSEYEAKMMDPETPADERDRIMMSLGFSSGALTKREQEVMADLDYRASLSNPNKVDMFYSALVINIPSFAKSAVPNPMLAMDAYDEQVSRAQARAKEQGIEYDTEANFMANASIAALQGSVEYLANKVGFQFIRGIPVKNVFGKITVRKLGALGLGRRAVAYAAQGVQAAVIEGGTEAIQQSLSLVASETTLINEAEKQGKEYIPMSSEQIKEEVLRAAEIGLIAGAGTSIAGSPAAVTRDVKARKVSIAENMAQAEQEAQAMDLDNTLPTSELTSEVERLKQTATEFDNITALEADLEIRTHLEGLTPAELVAMGNNFGAREGMKQEDLVTFLMGKKDQMPEYYEMANRSMLKTIEASDNSMFHKMALKWMSQGEVGIDEVGAIRVMFTRMATEQGYESVDTFMEDRMAFDKDSSSEIDFHHIGDTYDSGAYVKKGSTAVNDDSKFVIDLFKGGDMITLAHGFVHTMAPAMNPEMVRNVVDLTVEKHHAEASKPSQTATRTYMMKIWESYVANPMDSRFRAGGKDFKHLTNIQEMLASQFETYVGTRTAPSAQFIPTFKALAERYRDYYKDMRALPKEMQTVSHKTAVMFDEMIAGDAALTRPMSRKIEIEGKSMILYESRTSHQLRKKLLKAVQRVDLDQLGVHEQMQEYLKETIGNIKDKTVRSKLPNLRKQIELVSNMKEAMNLLEAVDKVHAQFQTKERNDAIGSILEAVNVKNLKDMDPQISRMIRKAIVGVDLSQRSEKRIRANMQLKKLLEDQLLLGMDEELMSISKKDLMSLIRLDDMNIYNMSMEQLADLDNAIKDLVRYGNLQGEQFIDNLTKTVNERNAQLKTENNKSWRLEKGTKKADAARTKGESYYKKPKGIPSVVKAYVQSLPSPSRILESLSDGKDGVLSQLYTGLKEGRYKSMSFLQQADDFRNNLIAGINPDLVSNALGKVADKDMITVKMNIQGKDGVVKKDTHSRGTNNESNTETSNVTSEIKVTQAELAMWYAYSKNPDGMRHLMEAGVTLRGGKDPHTYRFRSKEEFLTIISQLDPQMAKVTDKMMDYYMTVVAPEINAVSRELIGKDLATETNYMPLFIAWKDRGASGVLNMSEMSTDTRKYARQMIERMSFLNSRSGGAQPVYVTDMFAGVQENLDSVSHYVGMAQPIRDIRMTIFSDKGTYESVHQQMVHMIGKKGMEKMEDWVNDLEDPSYKGEELVTKLRAVNQVAKKGLLKMSPSIALMQTLSVQGCLNYGVTSTELATVLGKGALDPTSLGVGAKYSINQMIEMHPFLRDRFESTPVLDADDVSMNAKTRKGWLKDKSIIENLSNVESFNDAIKIARQIDDAGLLPLKLMDAWALSKQLEAMELTAKRLNWSENQLMDNFLEVIQRTQPVQDPLYTSHTMRIKNPLYRAVFTVFMSQRDALLGEMQTNWMVLQDAANGQADKAQVKQAGMNILRSYLVSNMGVSMIQELFYRLGKDNDDEEFEIGYLSRMLSNAFFFLPILGDMWSGTVNSMLRGWRNGSSGLLVQEQYVQGMDLAIRGVKAYNDGDEEEAYKLLIQSAARFSVLSGKGTANIERNITKIIKEIEK